jgi:hypothetical protein
LNDFSLGLSSNTRNWLWAKETVDKTNAQTNPVIFFMLFKIIDGKCKRVWPNDERQAVKVANFIRDLLLTPVKIL